MPHTRMSRNKRSIQDEYSTLLEERAKRLAREERLEAARDRQLRQNRKNEWTVVWQGGAPQSRKVEQPIHHLAICSRQQLRQRDTSFLATASSAAKSG